MIDKLIYLDSSLNNGLLVYLELFADFIFQEENFNRNWESNPGPLVLWTSLQTIMSSVFKYRNSLKVLVREPTSLVDNISAMYAFEANS